VEKLDPFRMTAEETAEVIKEASGCTVTWCRRDGQSCRRLCAERRAGRRDLSDVHRQPGKNVAWRRDPRTTLVFEVPLKGGVTMLGRVIFENDAALKQRVLNATADGVGVEGEMRERYLSHLNTASREVIRIVPEKYVTLHTGRTFAAMVGEENKSSSGSA
jgi:hypothetical protein